MKFLSRKADRAPRVRGEVDSFLGWFYEWTVLTVLEPCLLFFGNITSRPVDYGSSWGKNDVHEPTPYGVVARPGSKLWGTGSVVNCPFRPFEAFDQDD